MRSINHLKYSLTYLLVVDQLDQRSEIPFAQPIGSWWTWSTMRTTHRWTSWQLMNLINVWRYPSMNVLVVDGSHQRCEILFNERLCVSKKLDFVVLSTLEKHLSKCNVWRTLFRFLKNTSNVDQETIHLSLDCVFVTSDGKESLTFSWNEW